MSQVWHSKLPKAQDRLIETIMLLLSIALLSVRADAARFPEKVPGLMENCLSNAIENGEVTDTEDSHKYICMGDAAEQLWSFLERAKIKSYEQDVPEGRWLGRDFPLGACFKRTRMPDGTPSKDGMSCTIWIPRVVAPAKTANP